MDNKYKDYFDIDPDYFPAVNPDVIKSNPELWKKFYPHETFIKLIKDIVSVLNRQQKQNIWVEGAYGTGKSHAVLTLKHLLDSTEQETKEYFETFNLDQDLLKKFLYVKSEARLSRFIAMPHQASKVIMTCSLLSRRVLNRHCVMRALIMPHMER